MGARAAVAGASGYAGGELLRLLAGASRPGGRPADRAQQRRRSGGRGASAADRPPGLDDAVFAATDPGVLADADLVFLALPHGRVRRRWPRSLPGHVKVVDLGADFRLADAGAWAQYYPAPHAGHWTYGLPELPGAAGRDRAAATRGRARLLRHRGRSSRWPRCWRPAWSSPADIVIVVAASGTSGAGRLAAARPARQRGDGRRCPPTRSAARTGTPRRSSRTLTPNEPESAPRPRLRVVHPDAGADAARHPGHLHRPGDGARTSPRAGCARRSAPPTTASRSCTCCPEGRWPATGATLGSNAAPPAGGGRRRTPAAPSSSRALDNLGKGAAGQAVQNANLMLGLPETAGLTAHGVAP